MDPRHVPRVEQIGCARRAESWWWDTVGLRRDGGLSLRRIACVG
ncbi:MAG: hypothetical protein RL701_8117 [Pseudomonadota bacterium]